MGRAALQHLCLNVSHCTGWQSNFFLLVNRWYTSQNRLKFNHPLQIRFLGRSASVAGLAPRLLSAVSLYATSPQFSRCSSLPLQRKEDAVLYQRIYAKQRGSAEANMCVAHHELARLLRSRGTGNNWLNRFPASGNHAALAFCRSPLRTALRAAAESSLNGEGQACGVRKGIYGLPTRR